MEPKLRYLLLLTASAHLTVQAVLSPESTTRVLPLNPTPTIVGLPATTTLSTASCNVQASIPSTAQHLLHHTSSYFTPMSCLYDCLTTTACYSYSWNASSAAVNNSNCMIWTADISEFTPSNSSGVYFSTRDDCIRVVPSYSRNISAPFYGEQGLYINRAVHDCGIEGTANPGYQQYNEFAFNYSSILTCQDECDTENGCISYSYDYGASDGNCRMYHQWIAGVVTLGKTGVFYSDGTMKTGYKCFEDKAFGS